MRLVFKSLVFFFCIMTSCLNAKESFINEARDLFEKKNYEEAKFLFQRNIVFNQKNSESYVYLAKIFNLEENESEEKLLLKVVVICVELKRSNFSKVKELKEDFKIICKSLCDQTNLINEKLNNIQAIDES